MTIEQELKNLVLSRFKSVRDFTISIDMPYSTMDSIFKRGVANASIANIIKICEALSISVDDLACGKIVDRPAAISSINTTLTNRELSFIYSLREFNREGQEKVFSYMHDLDCTGQYKKNNKPDMVEEA